MPFLLNLNGPLIERLIQADVIISDNDTPWFVSYDKKLTRKVMRLFEALSSESFMIHMLTLGVNLVPGEKRFQMAYVDNTSMITQKTFPLHFICLDGILNAVNNTATQVQQYHNMYYNIIELQQIRDAFGERII